MLQSIEGQWFPTDCWPRFHFSTNIAEILERKFRSDLWSACHVLQPTGITVINHYLTKFLMNMNWHESVNWPKIPSPQGLEPAPHHVVWVQSSKPSIWPRYWVLSRIAINKCAFLIISKSTERFIRIHDIDAITRVIKVLYVHY